MNKNKIATLGSVFRERGFCNLYWGSKAIKREGKKGIRKRIGIYLVSVVGAAVVTIAS
ncbi:hypothetical protein [Flavobacterium sp. ZS1P14]|uniref:hypothetical protein n=1 Tax=Flavobacterium sp. ZS1P14 TaxID=3401729 RepID=UPI003AAB7C37